jgi:hypothetical protein
MENPLFKKPLPKQDDTNTKERYTSMFRIEYELMISVFELQNAVEVAAMPVQAWGGLEGSRRFRLEDLKTVDT